MKNTIKLLLLLPFWLLVSANAQTIEGFENVVLDSGKVLNGSDGQTVHYFQNGGMNFPVSWDTTYKYWSSGWALSKVNYNKVENSDYGKHLFAAAPGYGVEDGRGKAFMVGQNSSYFLLNNTKDFPLESFYVGNSTYALNSMKFGDFAGKKFGGKTGKDQDSFVLVVRCHKKGKLLDSQRIFLADFRFSDSTKDYISDKWTKVSVKEPLTDSISFELLSSDNGQWGMNTPAFFVLDGVRFLWNVSNKQTEKVAINIFPVPANTKLNIVSNDVIEEIVVTSLSGQVYLSMAPAQHSSILSTENLQSGIYVVSVRSQKGIQSRKIQVLH